MVQTLILLVGRQGRIGIFVRVGRVHQQDEQEASQNLPKSDRRGWSSGTNSTFASREQFLISCLWHSGLLWIKGLRNDEIEVLVPDCRLLCFVEERTVE